MFTRILSASKKERKVFSERMRLLPGWWVKIADIESCLHVINPNPGGYKKEHSRAAQGHI